MLLLSPALKVTLCALPLYEMLSVCSMSDVTVALTVPFSLSHSRDVTVALFRVLIPLVTDFNLDNMYDKLYGMFEQIASDKKFYQNALKLSSDDLTRYINRIANEQIAKLVKSLAIQNGLTAATDKDDIVIAEFIGYGICGVVIGWIQKGMKESPKEMTERLHSLIVSCKQLAIKRN